MTKINARSAAITWVAYSATTYGKTNAHAVADWNPQAASVLAACGRTLPLFRQLKQQIVTLGPQPDRSRCGYCVERLGRTNTAVVLEYRP